MATQTIADLRRQLANARCEFLSAREALRTRQPLIESELIARFCGGDPRRLGDQQVDRQRQLAVLCNANEELNDLRNTGRVRRDVVIRLSADLASLIDARRELEREALERLSDAIIALASSSVPSVAGDAVLTEVGGRLFVTPAVQSESGRGR